MILNGWKVQVGHLHLVRVSACFYSWWKARENSSVQRLHGKRVSKRLRREVQDCF